MPDSTWPIFSGSVNSPLRTQTNNDTAGTFSLATATIGQKGSPTNSTSAPTTSSGNVVMLAANPKRISAIMANNGSQTIFIGPSGVTTATGFPVYAGQSFVDDGTTAAWYGIVGSSTGDMRIIETAYS